MRVLFFWPLLAVCLWSCVNVYGHSPDSSLLRGGGLWQRLPSSRAYRMSYAAVPLIAGGFAMKGADARFRRLREGYLPRVRFHADDYLQYAPAALMLGLKAAGVEGRSSWGRMLAADAFSAGIMILAVNSLKYSTRVMRPDGSGRNSFPSGHTATAFMTATMLHKEYGLTRSPWYSIAGYSAATLTGLMRMANNKHWLSDVMVGAGIGILSAELGYWIADMIFKQKGLHIPEREGACMDMDYRPSFFGLYLGVDMLPGTYRLGNGSRVRFPEGSSVGVEGAWFANSRWGVGGRLLFSSTAWTLDGQAADDALETLCAGAGLYASFPLTPRWGVGTKLLGEYAHTFHASFHGLRIGERGGVGLGTGLALTFRAHEGMALRFFTDYTMRHSPLERGARPCHTLTAGGVVSILFQNKTARQKPMKP